MGFILTPFEELHGFLQFIKCWVLHYVASCIPQYICYLDSTPLNNSPYDENHSDFMGVTLHPYLNPSPHDSFPTPLSTPQAKFHITQTHVMTHPSVMTPTFTFLMRHQ